MSSEVWEALWDLLPEMAHVGVDLPGHGASPAMPLDLSMPRLGEALADIARRERVEHIVGMSFGGMIGLQVAAVMGTDLKTLFLASPSIGGGPQDAAVQSRNLELFRMHRERGAGPWLRELWMAHPSPVFRGSEANGALWSRLARVIDAHRWDELSDARMHRFVGHDQLAELKRIRADTLVAIGSDDTQAFKRTAELIRRGVARCRRIYIDGGHLPLLESPAAAAPLIRDHVLNAIKEPTECCSRDAS
jgi:pimeloyl-ACP methyl ester carboxylesterase